MKLCLSIGLCLFLIPLASASPARANNNLFLPGDAFFPTVLTKSDIAALQTVKTGARTFKYSSFDGYSAAFCGFAGYQNATIPAVDDPFAKNLKLVYEKIRSYDNRELLEQTVDGKTTLIETNGIRVLFYPPEFDFQVHYLGLQYNENWVEETIKFGHLKKHIRVCSLIDNPEAIGRSWRDAEDVAELPAETPKIKLMPVPATETPVVIQGPVQAIVIGSHSLNDLYEAKLETYYKIYVVNADGIQAIEYYNGTWTANDFEK